MSLEFQEEIESRHAVLVVVSVYMYLQQHWQADYLESQLKKGRNLNTMFLCEPPFRD